MATKDYSIKQEKMVATYLGWDCVVASGARPCHPGDLISDYWMGECKTHITSGNRIRFNFKEWEKICEEAMSKCKLPVMFVDDGSQTYKNTWCMINTRTTPKEYAPAATVCTIAKQSLFLTQEYIEMCDTSDLRALRFNFNGRDVLVMRLSTFSSIL